MSATEIEAGAVPAAGTAPGPPLRLRASRASLALLRELLAEAELDPDVLARLVESDPAVTVHVLQRANLGSAAGEERDTVAQAIETLDRPAVTAVLDELAPAALDAVPQLWRVLARALACERLAKDHRGYTVGLLSALGDLHGLPATDLLSTAGVSGVVAEAVLAHRGRCGAALGALLGYLADDPAPIARHGFDPASVYDAYVRGATTAMTTQSLIAEQGGRADHAVQDVRVAQVPQPWSRATRDAREVRPPVGAGASPSEEHR